MVRSLVLDIKCTAMPLGDKRKILTAFSTEKTGSAQGKLHSSRSQMDFSSLQNILATSLFQTMAMNTEGSHRHQQSLWITRLRSRAGGSGNTVKQKSQLIHIYYPKVMCVFKDMEKGRFTQETHKSSLQTDPVFR